MVQSVSAALLVVSNLTGRRDHPGHYERVFLPSCWGIGNSRRDVVPMAQNAQLCLPFLLFQSLLLKPSSKTV